MTESSGKSDRPIVTLEDVAQRAGVSTMTVSRVINKHDWVANSTRERVERAIAELGYVPNALASALSGKRTRTIGLIVNDIMNPFFTMIARGAEDVANQNGYTLFLGNSDASLEKERAYLDAMLSWHIDGVLITPVSHQSKKALSLLRQRKVPFVLVDRGVNGVVADEVVGDSRSGAFQLTEHLIALGHTRIALVNGPADVPTSHERHLGYEDAMRKHGLPVDPILITESHFFEDGGYQAALRLLAYPRSLWPTAIFATNTTLAAGAVDALRSADVRVPEDIALVVFDDIPLASKIDPFLTVMTQPARTFGTIAMRFLIDRINGTEPPDVRKVVLTPELIIRRSCGSLDPQMRRSPRNES